MLVEPQAKMVLAPTPPRAKGRVRLSVRRRDARTVLDGLHQSGSAKALLPRVWTPGLTAVLLNTAGGVTGGDRFEVEAHAADTTDLTLTTQAAERLYRALPGQTGRIETRLEAAVGATLRWLPQETIAFDAAGLERRLTIDMAADARVLAVEPLILGRAAMGETVRALTLRDRWSIRRDGELIYADTLRLDGDIAAITGQSGTLAGHRACATVILAAPDAERHLDAARARLPKTGGASLIRPGLLAIRLVARTGQALRRHLMPILDDLGGPLPQVWKM
ncbi:MAG: urease accessory protein UreD [Pseudomonadota bacterium]